MNKENSRIVGGRANETGERKQGHGSVALYETPASCVYLLVHWCIDTFHTLLTVSLPHIELTHRAEARPWIRSPYPVDYGVVQYGGMHQPPRSVTLRFCCQRMPEVH